MSVNRLPALTPQPPASGQAPRDIRAAQRAFFQAAIGVAPEAAAPAPAKAAPVIDPDRPLRPGSLVDIRI